MDSEVIVDTSLALLKNPSLDPEFGILTSLVTEPREVLEFLDPRCYHEGFHQNTAIHDDFEVDRKSREEILATASSYPDWFEIANNMHPDDLLILPCTVLGYVLRSRKWVSLDLAPVQPIAEQEGGFNSLVLPPGHKETLLALVETHSKGSQLVTHQKPVERPMDLVRGKDKGLIILLHGEPGVGKTSTAECVAGKSTCRCLGLLSLCNRYCKSCFNFQCFIQLLNMN